MGRDRSQQIERGEVAARIYSPFATIPTTLFATHRVRNLPGKAVRLLLLFEANWTPKAGAALPQRHAAKLLRARVSSIGKSIKILLEAGLIREKAPAVKPGAMGGGSGRGNAAVFDLPHRLPGAKVTFDYGDKRVDGFVRMRCADLRSVAGQLSDAAARVALLPLAVPRNRNGSANFSSADDGIDLSGSTLVERLPRMTSSTGSRAVRELLNDGFLRVVQAAAGSRPALYQPAGMLNTRIARRPVRRPKKA